jgi:hypothetical protein
MDENYWHKVMHNTELIIECPECHVKHDMGWPKYTATAGGAYQCPGCEKYVVVSFEIKVKMLNLAPGFRDC